MNNINQIKKITNIYKYTTYVCVCERQNGDTFDRSKTISEIHFGPSKSINLDGIAPWRIVQI